VVAAAVAREAQVRCCLLRCVSPQCVGASREHDPVGVVPVCALQDLPAATLSLPRRPRLHCRWPSGRHPRQTPCCRRRLAFWRYLQTTHQRVRWSSSAWRSSGRRRTAGSTRSCCSCTTRCRPPSSAAHPSSPWTALARSRALARARTTRTYAASGRRWCRRRRTACTRTRWRLRALWATCTSSPTECRTCRCKCNAALRPSPCVRACVPACLPVYIVRAGFFVLINVHRGAVQARPGGVLPRSW
jgi:hypothetical protein